MNNWIKAIVLGCIVLLMQNVSIDVYAQMNGNHDYESKRIDGKGILNEYILDEYNGKFIGDGIILRFYPEGDSFEGELIIGKINYLVTGILDSGKVSCIARQKDGNEDSIVFDVCSEKEENILRYSQKGKEDVLLIRAAFPEVDGVYEGNKAGLQLKIKRSKSDGVYQGTVKTGRNAVERLIKKEIPFIAEEKGGRIWGTYTITSRQTKKEEHCYFTIEYEDSELCYIESATKVKLKVCRSTEHIRKAREAKEREDWETVKKEAEIVKSYNEYHQQEANELKNEANKELNNRKNIQDRLKKAKTYVSKAKTRADWLNAQQEVKEVLDLSPRNDEALELKEWIENELQIISQKNLELPPTVGKIAEYTNDTRGDERKKKQEKVANAHRLKEVFGKEGKQKIKVEEKKAISYEIKGGYFIVNYVGTLYQSSDAINWTKMESVSNPYRVKMKNKHLFFYAKNELQNNHFATQQSKEEEKELMPKVKIEVNKTISLGDGVELEMIWIEPGTFTMGSPEDELGRDNEETLHEVTLTKGYYLGKYEVTQAQYETVTGKNPSYFKGDNLPVEMVSWYDAKAFCEKLTLQEKTAGRLPQGYEYTLPTEAQWEYACRAGTMTALNNGKNLSDRKKCFKLNEVGWYSDNSNGQTHPVGQKQANSWGLYDMHGNVYEWCLDWYRAYPTSAMTDPMESAIGSSCVLRGGCWVSFADYCRSANRNYYNPSNPDSGHGFRVALVPVQ